MYSVNHKQIAAGQNGNGDCKKTCPGRQNVCFTSSKTERCSRFVNVFLYWASAKKRLELFGHQLEIFEGLALLQDIAFHSGLGHLAKVAAALREVIICEHPRARNEAVSARVGACSNRPVRLLQVHVKSYFLCCVFYHQKVHRHKNAHPGNGCVLGRGWIWDG